MTPRILAFAGSLRAGSWNKKLVAVAAAAARGAGAEVTLLDLRDLPMPIYDGDIEAQQGLPPNALAFKQLMRQHQGILVSSPEYNSQMPAVLKNAIDWASRPEPGDTPLVAFKGKVAGVMSASPGVLAGLRGQMQVRALLSYLGMILVPAQFGLPRANEAFDGEGRLKDEKQQAAVEAIAGGVVDFSRRHA
jgi:chromate reductase, NAD(P)H dehydrogenase (quinone)